MAFGRNLNTPAPLENPYSSTRSDSFSKDFYWLQVSPRCGGVYIYIRDKKLQYVGKTSDTLKRFNFHHVLTPKILRRVARSHDGHHLHILPCDEPFRSHIEAFLIYTFQPPLNSVQPSIEWLDEYEETYFSMIQEVKDLCSL